VSLVFSIAMVVSALAANRSFPPGNNGIRDSVETLVKPDSATKKTRTLFFGSTYGNNSSFLGRYQTKVLPYYSADVSYKSKTGLWLSLLGYDITNTLTFMDEVDIIAGWNINLSKRIDVSAFYTRYFFRESTELIKASVANTLTAAAGLDWTLVYTKVSAHYNFGGTDDFFLVLDNSRYIEFPKVFSKRDYLSLDPRISIISGTQTFVDTHYINRGTPLFNPPGGGPSPPRGRPGPGSGSTSTAESFQTTFNVLSYEFTLPASYTIGNLSFELTARYSIPVNLLEGDTSVPQFFFTGGILYSISSK
jgi:hypothetical protein